MFNVVDMDPEDDTIEVIASQFFGEKVTLHSIQRGPTPKMTFKRVIDNKCGKAFGCILSDLAEGDRRDYAGRQVVDAGSTVASLQQGDSFSHLLVTSHECRFIEDKAMKTNVVVQQAHNSISLGTPEKVHHLGKNILRNYREESPQQSTTTTTTIPLRSGKTKNGMSSIPVDGGSLFAYRVPDGPDKWKTGEWTRTTVASGFKVQGQLNNMINPGAPGFVYTFHARQENALAKSKKRPLIAVAGDCAESAYIFRPVDKDDCSDLDDSECDPSAQYDLMCEIKCGATVGSIAVGYGDLCGQEQESGYAKLYIPCYESDKILVFGLGSGED